MPNWVANSVVIKGTEIQIWDIKLFLAKNHFMTGEEIEFNFANLVSIPEDKLEEYTGVRGFVEGVAIGDTEYNWYNWNVNNWGTKWNALDVDVEAYPDEICYRFNTPWSLPEGVILALADKCRGTGMTFEWFGEEEQGWGCEYYFDGNELHIVSEWDIPNCHADYVARGKDCLSCEYFAEYGEGRFDDCPTPDLTTAEAVSIMELTALIGETNE